MDFVWKTILLTLVGFFLLRVSGRKSIAQMTIAPTVVMISVGNIIVEPIIETSTWKTIIATMVMVTVLIVIEYLQLKFNLFENFISGKAVVVIDNGVIVEKNLKRARVTVDQLETQLRLQGIENISDVKTATVEPNGQIGYQLAPDAKPVTVGELKKMLGYLIQQNEQPSTCYTIFDEVKQKGHEKRSAEQLQ